MLTRRHDLQLITQQVLQPHVSHSSACIFWLTSSCISLTLQGWDGDVTHENPVSIPYTALLKSCVALSACYCGVSPQTLRMLMPLEHTWPHRSQLASSVLSDGRIAAAAQEFSQCQVCVAYKLLQKWGANSQALNHGGPHAWNASTWSLSCERRVPFQQTLTFTKCPCPKIETISAA